MSFQEYKLLWLLMSIIIALYVAISSNITLVNYTTLAEVENNPTFTLLCNMSMIACLSDITHLPNNSDDIKISTDLILDQVNSTKLKEWIDILSSFHTRNSKSSYIEDVAYWLKSELQNLCHGRVFFHNYTQIDQNQTFNLNNIICSNKQSLASSLQYNKTIIIGAHYDSRAEILNNTNTRAPGADDNASGVSTLLELCTYSCPIKFKT